MDVEADGFVVTSKHSSNSDIGEEDDAVLVENTMSSEDTKTITTTTTTTTRDSTTSNNEEESFVVVEKDNDNTSTTPAAAADTAEEVDTSSRGPPLSLDVWNAFFDKSGRLLDESGFKKTVFRGGIDTDVRKLAWPFLMGYYDFQSSYTEREIIIKEKRIEYAAMKERWQEELGVDAAANGDGDVERDEDDDQYQFMFIQAKVNAMRTPFDEEAAQASIKTIEKDVPRTDRKGNYFSDDQPHRLQWLHDILVTYAVYHPTVGYAQGMNDVLSMILAVMDHEADAYWCFRNYLETIQADFMAKGMMDKLEHLRELLAFMDPEILKHFNSIDAGDMVFCHRWLLLTFKREFSFEDAVRLFEILCSHHLELSSIEAEKARDQEIRSERERELGANSAGLGQAVERGLPQTKYTFELFVCIAILKLYRKDLLKAGDVADIFTFINGLVMKMNLDHVLATAESCFFDFCRLSVTKADDEAYLLLSKSVTME